jgi:hypothetical protein
MARTHEPWKTYRFGDKEMNAADLADLLREFDVKPRKYKTGRGKETARGYYAHDLREAFRRYLPTLRKPGTPGTSGTSGTKPA